MINLTHRFATFPRRSARFHRPQTSAVDPEITAAREVEEETGWRPRNVRPLLSMQPMVGSADAENLLFVADGADHTGQAPDVNEAARVAWIPPTSAR